MRNWSGAHRITYGYNDIGLQTEINIYDENGNLFVGTNGYSRVLKKYDSNARICGYSRFDGNTPALTINSLIKYYHSIRLTYDEKNRITQIEYLDKDDKPTNAQIDLGEIFLCNKIELKYVANRLTEERFYTKNTSFPSKIIDCLKNDFVDPHGTIFGHKNRK